MGENHSDETLMAEVGQGIRSAYELLVRRWASPLLGFVFRMIGDQHRAEELFQEVWLAVWQKRHTYQHPRPFKAWLFAIAVNHCRSSFRKKSLPLTPWGESTDMAEGEEVSPMDQLITTETSEEIAGAVALLPIQQRTVLVLRIWQDHSYAEIAQIMKITEPTARSHMHHALAALRKRMAP